MQDKEEIDGIILEKVNEVIPTLFTQFLVILEDLQEEHRATYVKLLESIPEEYHPILFQADYFNDRKMEWIRKRVLDIGNQTKRKNEDNFKRFSIHFKFKPN